MKPIEVGQIVNYLGIALEVTAVNDAFVSLMRKSGGSRSVTINVMVGSARYYAIFPEAEKSKSKIEFNSDEQPEVTYDRDGDLSKVINSKENFTYDRESVFGRFIRKYSFHTSEMTAQEAMVELKKDIAEDETGITAFYANCYAYQKSAVKYPLWETIGAVDAMDKSNRPYAYKPELLQLYLASIQDDNLATEMEYVSLNNQLPIKEVAEIVCAICAWDFEGYDTYIPDGKLILSRKQVLEVLKD